MIVLNFLLIILSHPTCGHSRLGHLNFGALKNMMNFRVDPKNMQLKRNLNVKYVLVLNKLGNPFTT